jgi:transcription initiation factor TFIID TATA-box-binding protein
MGCANYLLVPKFEVANVVGSIMFQQELNLTAFENTFRECDKISGVIYEPAENHWLQTRFGEDEKYVAFYRGGRSSVAGCDSIAQFESIADEVVGVMRDLLDFDYEPRVEVNNIVAKADIAKEIPLESLMIHLGMENTEYEPEQFPGLIYRKAGDVTLMFASGKILVTGHTDMGEVADSVERIASLIEPVVKSD